MDFVVEGISRSLCAMIVTTRAEEISAELSKNFQASGTIVNAVGGYSREEKAIVYFIVNHFQVNKMKTIVHGIDEAAYISVQEVSDVFKAPSA